MGAKVTINDRDLASKRTNGSAVGFPNPCWTVPPPPKPITYPSARNNATIKSGTCTVLHRGKTIAVFPRACCGKSVGDLAALPISGPKWGVVTSANQDSGYFGAGSNNTFMECGCTCRMGDISTGNQKCMVLTNAPPTPWIAGGGCPDGNCKA